MISLAWSSSGQDVHVHGAKRWHSAFGNPSEVSWDTINATSIYFSSANPLKAVICVFKHCLAAHCLCGLPQSMQLRQYARNPPAATSLVRGSEVDACDHAAPLPSLKRFLHQHIILPGFARELTATRWGQGDVSARTECGRNGRSH
ncbi:hypothetical protein M758_UG085300 [Ceratodon purpureus]|nr:hypothetical protein M758_UG085300 [Ceratodon purpureus]